MKSFLKKKLTNTGPKPLNLNTSAIKKHTILGQNFIIKKFGEKNSSKIFYCINRSPGAGLFSNLTFVLNHLR